MALTSVIRYVRALDNSVTTGAGKTGLAFSDITAKYLAVNGVLTSLTTETITTLGTYQAPTSAAHIRIKELNSADPTKGIYEVHFHNTQVANWDLLYLFLSASGAAFQPLQEDLKYDSSGYKFVSTVDIPVGSDASDLLDVKLDAIPTAAENATQVRTELGTELARIDAAISSRQVALWAAVGSTVNLSGTTIKNVTDINTLLSDGSYGLAALLTAVQNIQNNTDCVRAVPTVIERPDSGTTTYRVELLLYDDIGNMEAPDSAPTIALVNQSGTDRSSRLDSTTMALVSTGRYRAIYTATSTDTLEQLVWTFSVVEGGATRVFGNASLIVDTSAVDFTAADRTKLDAITLLIDVATSTRLAASAYTTPPTAATNATAVRTELGVELARIDATISSRVAATLFAGITSVGNWLRAIMRSGNIDATTTSEINATTGSGTGTYASSSNSLQAIRDRGDVAWTTGGGGGSSHDVELVIQSVTSQTVFETSGGDPPPDSEFEGRLVLIENTTGGSCVRTIVSMTGSEPLVFTIDEACDFTVAVDDTFTILAQIAPSGSPISSQYIDDDHMWRFEADDELTAANTIREVTGFDALLGMDFTEPIPEETSLYSAVIVEVSPSTGVTFGTLELSPDKLKAHIPTVVTTPGTYIVAVQGTTTDGQKYTRRGIAVFEEVV